MGFSNNQWRCEYVLYMEKIDGETPLISSYLLSVTTRQQHTIETFRNLPKKQCYLINFSNARRRRRATSKKFLTSSGLSARDNTPEAQHSCTRHKRLHLKIFLPGVSNTAQLWETIRDNYVAYYEQHTSGKVLLFCNDIFLEVQPSKNENRDLHCKWWSGAIRILHNKSTTLETTETRTVVAIEAKYYCMCVATYGTSVERRWIVRSGIITDASVANTCPGWLRHLSSASQGTHHGVLRSSLVEIMKKLRYFYVGRVALIL